MQEKHFYHHINDKINKGSKSQIISLMVSFALAFVCITINSKLSFLYTYHDIGDVQCFITVARCMLRGDVLYRDVYEHKGPLHYFLYSIGFGSTGSLLGVYVIETLLFAAFLYEIYRIATIFVKNGLLSYVITAAISIWASTRNAFCSGGECEELTLPFVTMALYLALKESAGEFPAPLWKNTKNVKHKELMVFLNAVIIGFCFATVFWSKYTITGSFAGYVFAVLIIGIINKDGKYILRRAAGFAAGVLFGSIPVLIYFSVHNAFGDLWEVYFYNLIFKYSQNNFGETVFLMNLKNMASPWVIVALVGVIMAPKQILKKEGKIYAVLMTTLAMIGLSAGKVWGYVYEAMAPFAVLLCIGIIGIIGRLLCFERIRIWVFGIRDRIKERLKKELEERQKIKLFLYRALVEKKQVTGRVLIVVIILYVAYFTFTVNIYSDAIGAKPESFPIVRVSKKVCEIQPNDPVIISFTSLDTGIYYWTDTLPPDKYFCRYNLFTIKELGYYEKYVETGKADFIIAYAPIEDVEGYGYSLCYEERNVSTMDDALTLSVRSYFLYARNDLVG